MSKHEVLLIGHSWVKYLFAAKKIARQNDIQFDSQWWPNANLDAIIQNVEMFRPIKAYHKNVLVFCLIAETWRYETLDNTEPIYDSNGLPINPYQILMPNTDFVVSEFIEKFSKFRNYCYKYNPNINVLLMAPPRIDVYQFNLELISKFPESHQEIFHENPKYKADKMAEHSRNIYGKIAEVCTFNHGWPEKSIFRNQIVAQKVKGCRKIFSKFMKQEVDTLGKEGPFVDGIHPSEDLIKIFWSQVKSWLVLNPPINSFSDLPPMKPVASVYPEIGQSNKDSLSVSEDCIEKEMADSAKKVTCPDEQIKILLLGDSWVKYIDDEKNISSEYGFEMESKWWPNAKLETIMKNVEDCVKPYHKHLLIFCLLSETWRYEFLENISSSSELTSDQTLKDYASPGFPPTTGNQIIMPNPDFSISEFIDNFNKIRLTCLKLNPNLNVVLMIPPVIDAYQYNLELISKYPESVQDLFYKNPKYGASQLAEHSRSLNGNLSAMCRRWPTSCFIRSQVVCEKVPWAKNIYMRFRRRKLDTCGKDGPLVDGLNPSVDVIKSFWNILKFWLELNEEFSRTIEPLEDGQVKVLMIGDESIKGLDFGQHSGMSLPTIHYVSHGNLDQMIKLADTYLSYKVDVLFLAPFNWEFLYLTSYVPYEEEPKVPLINENIDMAKILETVKLSTENWQQTFPKLKIIWGFPCPINFRKFYEFRVAEYGLPWTPTPEMEFEILYITKAFYALILQLEKEWSQNLPKVNYIDLRKCFFAEATNLEYTFCDSNEPKFPLDCLMENGLVPSKSVSQWFKLNLIDKVEEMEKEFELALLRDKRKKERQKFLFRKYLKKKEILDFLNKDLIVEDGKPSNKPPLTNLSTNIVANVNQQSASDPSSAIANEVDQNTEPNPYDTKKERRRRRRERIKAAKLQESAGKVDEVKVVEPAIPRLMDIPINDLQDPPEGQDQHYVDSRSSLLNPVSSSMLNMLGETLSSIKTNPVVNVAEKNKLLVKENLGWAELAKEEFLEVSPFRILDIKESPYSYQLSLFFQRSRWEDMFLKGNKTVATDVILSAIKAMLMLKNEPGVKIMMITTSVPFIKEIEHHLKPVVDKKLVGVNDSVSFGTPSVLIDTPLNLNQKLMDPNRKWDILGISALIVFGDDLISNRRSPITMKFPHVVNLVYTDVLPERVNKVVISEKGADELEQGACQILRTKFSRKQAEAVCPPPEDKSLSLFELLASELDKDAVQKKMEDNHQSKMRTSQQKFSPRVEYAAPFVPYQKNQKTQHEQNLGPKENPQPPHVRNQFTSDKKSVKYDHRRAAYNNYSRGMANQPPNAMSNCPGSGFSKNNQSSLVKPSISDNGEMEEAKFAVFLKTLGPVVEKEYFELGKNILLSNEKHHMNYLNNPSEHEDYAPQKEKFSNDFQKKAGANYDKNELESSWNLFWKNYIKDIKEFELKKKLTFLQEDFRKKYSSTESTNFNLPAEYNSNDISIVNSYDNLNKIEIFNTKDASNLNKNNLSNQNEKVGESNDIDVNSSKNLANEEEVAIHYDAKKAFNKLFKSWDPKKTNSSDDQNKEIKDAPSDEICITDVDASVSAAKIAEDTSPVQSGDSTISKSQDKLPGSITGKNNVVNDNIVKSAESELIVNAQGSNDSSENLTIDDDYLKQLLLREYPKKVKPAASVAVKTIDFQQQRESDVPSTSDPAGQHFAFQDSFNTINDTQSNFNYNERINLHDTSPANQGYKSRAQSSWGNKSSLIDALTVEPEFSPRVETSRGNRGGKRGGSRNAALPFEQGYNKNKKQTRRGNNTRDNNPRGKARWSDEGNPNTEPLGPVKKFKPNPKDSKTIDYSPKITSKNPWAVSEVIAAVNKTSSKNSWMGSEVIATVNKNSSKNSWMGSEVIATVNKTSSKNSWMGSEVIATVNKTSSKNSWMGSEVIAAVNKNTSKNSLIGSDEVSLLNKVNSREFRNSRRNSNKFDNVSSRRNHERTLSRDNYHEPPKDRFESKGKSSDNRPEGFDLRNNMSKKSKPNPIETSRGQSSYNRSKPFRGNDEMNKQEFYDSLKQNKSSANKRDNDPLTPKPYGAGREPLLPKNRQQFYDSIQNMPSNPNKRNPIEQDFNSGPRKQFGSDSRKNRYSNLNQRAGNEVGSNQTPQNQYGESRERLLPKSREEFGSDQTPQKQFGESRERLLPKSREEFGSNQNPQKQFGESRERLLPKSREEFGSNQNPQKQFGESRERLLPKSRQEFYDSIKSGRPDSNITSQPNRDFNYEQSNQFGQSRELSSHKNRQEFYDSMKSMPSNPNKRPLDEDYNIKAPTQGSEMPLHQSRQEFYDSMKNMSNKGYQHNLTDKNTNPRQASNQFGNRNQAQRSFNNNRPTDNYVKKDKDVVLLENTLNSLDPICDAIGMIGPSLRLIITHAKSCLPNIKATLKVFTEEESVALLNFAITKMRTLAVGRDMSRYLNMIKESTELLEQAKASLISKPIGNTNPLGNSGAQTSFSVDIKLIARATTGKDAEHIYQFIKNTYLYKGLPEPSTNELEGVFMAVKQIHSA